MIEMIGAPRSRNHRALAAECAFERREAHKENYYGRRTYSEDHE